MPRRDDTEELRLSHLHALGAARAPVRSACLLVVAGAQSGRVFREGADMLIGRGADAAVCIDDDGISRHHARLTAAPGGTFCLTDHRSRNGTFRNGRRLTAPETLEDGDLISVGRTTVLKFAFQDASEEQLLRTQYALATRDALTGLFNRRYFDDWLQREFSHARRFNTILSLVLLDIDHFKRLNDTYGHPVGDQALRHLGAVLAAMTRQSEVAARYGGEEFAAVLRDSDGAASYALAERWRQHLAVTPCDTTAGPVGLTCSFGVACSDEPNIDTAAALVVPADTKLYRAKRGGRNRTVF